MSTQWWKDRWNGFVDNLIWWGAVVVVGLTAGSVIWAGISGWFSSQWAPLTVLLGLGVVAFAVLILERLSAWRARSPFRRLSDSDLRELIQRWLVSPRISVTEHSTTETGLAFCLHVVPREQGAPIVQITYSSADTVVSLSMFYIVPNAWHAEFDEMTGKREITMLEDVQIELAHFEVGYEGIIHPLRKVMLVDQVAYDEAFTKIRLLQRMVHLEAAYSALSAIITRAGKRAFLQEAIARRSTQQTGGATPPSAGTPEDHHASDAEPGP